MRIGLSIHVLMGNDYPEGVFLTRRGLDRAILRHRAEDAGKRPYGPGIHWRGYEFPIGPQVKWTRRWWRRIR